MKQHWKDKPIDPLQEYNAESHRLTIESIQSALLKLLRNNDIERITIKEIVESAGVSRSAFYKNYQSKEEVLQSIIYDRFQQTASSISKMDVGSNANWEKLVITTIKQYEEMYDVFYGNMLSEGTMLQCMNDYLDDMIKQTNLKDGMMSRFIMGGIHNCVQFWLDSGKKDSAEQLARKIMFCITGE